MGITYARWREDGFDAPFVVSELAKGVSASPEGELRFSGDTFFGDPLILLATGIEFSEPISDADRSGIINRALEAALRSTNFGPKVLIAEMNKATRDFVLREQTDYMMATGLSFRHFEDISRRESSGCRIYVQTSP